MPQNVLNLINGFIDARSSLGVPGNEEIRRKLSQVLVDRVGDTWADYVKFYEGIFDSLNDEDLKGVLNSKALKLQEKCELVVKELENVKQSGYSQDSLFIAKELVIGFEGAVEEFRLSVEAEFSSNN